MCERSAISVSGVGLTMLNPVRRSAANTPISAELASFVWIDGADRFWLKADVVPSSSSS